MEHLQDSDENTMESISMEELQPVIKLQQKS